MLEIILIICIGLFLIAMAVFNWDWAFAKKSGGLLQKILPRIVLRVIYILAGLAVIVYAVTMAL